MLALLDLGEFRVLLFRRVGQLCVARKLIGVADGPLQMDTIGISLTVASCTEISQLYRMQMKQNCA